MTQYLSMNLCLATLINLANTAQASPGVIQAKQLAVKGISISDVRSQVFAAFGKPGSTSKGRDKLLGKGNWERMKYPGLLIEVAAPEIGYLKSPQKEPYVCQLIITSKAWATRCGIRVGCSRDQVITILGMPRSESNTDGATVFHYEPQEFDGSIWLKIRNNKVFEIGMAEDWS